MWCAQSSIWGPPQSTGCCRATPSRADVYLQAPNTNQHVVSHLILCVMALCLRTGSGLRSTDACGLVSFSGNFQDESGNEQHATPVADVVRPMIDLASPMQLSMSTGTTTTFKRHSSSIRAWIERSLFGSNWTIHLDRHKPLSTRILTKSKATAGTCISFLIHWMHLATVLEQAVGTSCVVTRPNIIWGMRT